MLGRFISLDPAALNDPMRFLEDPQQLNFYSYARNNPMRYVDPSGEAIKEDLNIFFQWQTDIIKGVGDFITFGGFSDAFNRSGNAGQKIAEEGVNVGTVANLLKEVTIGAAEIAGPALLEGVTAGVGAEVSGGAKILQGTAKVTNATTKIAAKESIWSATKTKTSAQNAFGHWLNHGDDFPELKNAVQYVKKAKEFFTNSPKGTQTLIKKNGDIVKYNNASQTFGVSTKNLTPKTLYKAGGNYWNNVIKKLSK